ncbi:MAG TPA: type II secretion system F family protein [Xanthobacteraceae bacterium]|jgi:general secretion pathway protein F|nr:type II secretion system F family protein [Xanthobacteraceae bacterium]
MPMFRYRAYGARGEFSEGSIEAASQEAATIALGLQGLTPFQVKPAAENARPWWQRDVFSLRGSIQKDLTGFTREFATLHTAEIPLDDALRIVIEQTTSARTRAVVEGLLADVLNGSTLSDAMQKRSDIFPADYVSVVTAGEIGGHVGDVFEELADLLERRMEIRSRVQSAFVYPVILIVLALSSFAIIIGVLVPGMAPIFAESNRQMPSGLRLILSIHALWPQILVGIGLLVAIVASTSAIALRKRHARLAFDAIKLRTPLIGAFLLQQETARFARTFGTLLKSGVPLLQAAISARTVVNNLYMGTRLEEAIASVREGTSLHRALRAETTLPQVALRMISIGEEAGKLDRMLIRVAVMLEQQMQRSIDRFMTILTPLLTLIIAVLVGGLIMTVMNAILSMNDLVFR